MTTDMLTASRALEIVPWLRGWLLCAPPRGTMPLPAPRLRAPIPQASARKRESR